MPAPHSPLARHATTGKMAALKDHGRVFLLAATLRPETMAGQTNCWALPEGKYGVYRGLGDELYVVTERAALNMAFQVRARVGGCGCGCGL